MDIKGGGDNLLEGSTSFSLPFTFPILIGTLEINIKKI